MSNCPVFPEHMGAQESPMTLREEIASLKAERDEYKQTVKEVWTALGNPKYPEDTNGKYIWELVADALLQRDRLKETLEVLADGTGARVLAEERGRLQELLQQAQATEKQLASDVNELEAQRAGIETQRQHYVELALIWKHKAEEAQAKCAEMGDLLRLIVAFDKLSQKAEEAEKTDQEGAQVALLETLGWFGLLGRAENLLKNNLGQPLLDRLRRAKETCATVYQWAAANDFPVEILDNLSIIAEGDEAEETPERPYHDELPMAVGLAHDQLAVLERALREIGNRVGAPTMHYAPDIESRELKETVQAVSLLVQEALAVCPKERNHV